MIPLALVGYEMSIANSALRASLIVSYLSIYHLISDARSLNDCQVFTLHIFYLFTFPTEVKY